MFDKVYGGDKFKSKEDLIRKLRKKMKLKKSEVAYVGDRAGDIKMARKAGCLSIAVINKYSWNPKEEIMKEKPDFAIRNLKQLRRLF